MRKVFLLLFVFVYSTIDFASGFQVYPCAPGLVDKEDCRICTCGADGQIILCTRLLCKFDDDTYPFPVTEESTSKKSLDQENLQDEAPIKIWDEDEENEEKNLNKERIEDGTPIVTRDEDPETTRRILNKERIEIEIPTLAGQDERRKICKPGKIWNADCNRCFCNDEGTSARCTRRRCPHTLSAGQLLDVRSKLCHKYQVDCNTCTTCLEGSTEVTHCTRKKCPEQLIAIFSETPVRRTSDNA